MGQVNCTYSVTAAAGDTCASLAKDWDITTDQLETYNPSIGLHCVNGIQPGKTYCVEATITPVKPSGASSSTAASSHTASSSVISSTTTTTTTTTTTSSSSSSTFVTVTTTSAAPAGPSPTQDGLISNCQKFYKVQSGDTCDKIVSQYRTFTTADLVRWNPAINNACTSLWVDYYICVAVPGTPTKPPTTTAQAPPAGPSPTQAGLIASCNRYHQVASGDTCQSIQSKYNSFTLPDFYKWNPAVGQGCSSLWTSYFVCIGVPGNQVPPPPPQPPKQNGPQPQQPGIPASCNKFHLVQAGDFCQKIADQYHIALQQFYHWNPSVGNDCKALWGGYNVCVGSS